MEDEEKLEEIFNMFVKKVKSKIDLSNYSHDEWFEAALSTVNFGNLYRIIKSQGYSVAKWARTYYFTFQKKVFRLLSDLETKIDSISDEMDRISENVHVPLGVVQKCVTIIAKYIISAYYCFKNIDKIKEQFQWVTNIDVIKKIPAPIDSKVLKSLDKLTICDDASSKNTFRHSKIAWSRLNKANYNKIQNEIWRLSVQNKMFPIELEMKELWK